MPTKLTEYAVERSTFAVTAAFTDEDGDAVTPSAITWTLCNEQGAIINSLQDQVVSSPAASITIVLSGADLQILNEDNESETRHLEVSATYDSALGSDLPSNERAEFKVINLKALS